MIFVRDPQRLVNAKLASIRRRSGAPAAKRALYRLVTVPKAQAKPPAPLTSAQRADRARAEMAALRARHGL